MGSILTRYGPTEMLSELLYLLRVYLCFQRSCIISVLYCVAAARITREGIHLLPVFFIFLSVFFKEVLWNCSQRAAAGT